MFISIVVLLCTAKAPKSKTYLIHLIPPAALKRYIEEKKSSTFFCNFPNFPFRKMYVFPFQFTTFLKAYLNFSYFAFYLFPFVRESGEISWSTIDWLQIMPTFAFFFFTFELSVKELTKIKKITQNIKYRIVNCESNQHMAHIYGGISI